MAFYPVLLSLFFENVTLLESITEGTDVTSCLALTHGTWRVVQ